jgi:hypothetical protein
VTERLGPDALRELFLFEKLSDEQLAWLAERGEVRSYPAGVTVYAAGEPATTLFVLLEGTLSMAVRGLRRCVLRLPGRAQRPLVHGQRPRGDRLPLLGAARRRLRLGDAGVVPDGNAHA